MASESNASNSPVPLKDLNRIATEACESTLQSTNSYDHTLVSDWNSQIINKVLANIIQASTKPSSDPSATTTTTTPQNNPPYRFNVNSTIVQQAPPPAASPEPTANGHGHSDTTNPTTNEPSSEQTPPSTGRRGMHSASGAYWDVKKDGMWTFKYSGAEEKGMDVVLSVIWFATG